MSLMAFGKLAQEFQMRCVCLIPDAVWPKSYCPMHALPGRFVYVMAKLRSLCHPCTIRFRTILCPNNCQTIVKLMLKYEAFQFN